MQVKDFIFYAKMRLKRGVVSVTLDEMTLRILFNMALQKVRPLIMQWDRSFYVRTQAFGAATSFAQPADFERLLFLRTPSAAFGAARISHFAEAREMENNEYLKGVADSPHAWVDQGTVEIRPSTAATMFYISKFGEITDTTYDVTAFGDTANPALIPIAWEHAVILYMVKLALERHLQSPQTNPSEAAILGKQYQDAKRAWDVALIPFNITDKLTDSPAYPPQQQARQ